MKQFSSPFRIRDSCQDKRANLSKRGDPLLEGVVKLSCKQVADFLGQGGSGPARSDGDLQASSAQDSRQDEIAGAGIVSNVDADAALASVGRHLAIDVGSRGSEHQLYALKMLRAIWFLKPAKAIRRFVSRSRFQTD